MAVDLMKFASMFMPMTSIISVEKLPDGTHGTIRVEGANEASIKVAEMVFENRSDSVRNVFVPGLSYENYMKKELNFENFCYQCAVLKKPVHAYIRPEHFKFWINIVMIPLAIQEGNKYFCSYSQEISTEADLDTMTNISAEVSSNVLKTCIKLRGSKDFKASLGEIVEDIRKLCGADSCSILQTNFKENTWSVLAATAEEGALSRSLDEIFSEDFLGYSKEWVKFLDGSNCLILKNESDFDVVRKNNPLWYDSLKGAGVRSLVLLPLIHYGDYIGFIWVTDIDTSKVLSIKETLELTAFFIASEVANYQLLKRLEYLSNVDVLTGVKNRNSMNNQVIRSIQGHLDYNSVGVIFADLNGLKTVNDTEGHEAGDKLLQRAASVLSATFDGYDIYRAGGDEYVIVALDKPKQELADAVERLRKQSEIPGNVSFAVGFYYGENGEDIRTALSEADSLMYEDKKRYYDRFPELRRR